METSIQKWGNSLGVRIPKELASKLSMTEGSSVIVDINGKNLVIRSIKKKSKISLKTLLEGVTEENRHSEVFDDGPVGKEVW